MDRLILLFVFLEAASGSPAESRLMNDLLRGITPQERPVADNAEPVVVQLGVSLQQLIDLDEKMETLTVNAWLTLQWFDINLRWQPAEYQNISDIRIPNGRVWSPDILLYNSVDNQFDTTYKVNLLVRHTGIYPPGILTISCKLDIYFWPFDEQVCFFKFGSWSHSGRQIELVPNAFSTSEYMTNGEWVLLRTWVEREEKFYGLNEPFQSVRFFLRLRRRTLYYAFNLLMPVMLVMVIVLLGFVLSPFSCEKIGLQISVSLAICIFMTLLANNTPQTSESVPLLGLFFQSCMVISVLATGATVYVQSVHFRSHGASQRMGFWMRYFLLELFPFLLRIKEPKRVHTFRTVRAGLRRSNDAADKKEQEQIESEAFARQIEDYVQEVSKTDQIMAAQIVSMNKIYGRVKTLRESHDDAVEEDQNRSEWQFAATVVDRICLTLVSGLFFVTTGVFLLAAPYLVA